MVNNSPIEGYESYVRERDGLQTLSLKIDGVHCAGCIQKIESSLSEWDEMQSARLNFTTGSLKMAWDGTPFLANDFVAKITSLGYVVHPIDFAQEETQSESKEQ